MQNLPRLSFFQWSGMMLVLFFGTVALMNYPVGAQVDGKAADANQEKDAEPKKDAEEKPAPAKPAPEAKKLFESAREKLSNRLYRAKIVQKLTLADRTIYANGEILRGPKWQMRLQYEVKTGGTTGKLVQVCDGDKLWTERRVNDEVRLSMQDVKAILGKVGPQPTPANLAVAEMGLGGITSLLASLDRTMIFAKPETVDIDGESLFRTDGGWNADFRARAEANRKAAPGLPDYIPDGARVYFDADDFPRRIQYLKKIGKSDVLKPIVTLDFVDVAWLAEGDVDPSKFNYELPQGVFPEDVTKAYLDALDRPAPGTAPAAAPKK